MSALREAYELIKDPADWCQGTLAQLSADGSRMQRCAVGALSAAMATEEDRAVLVEVAASLFPEQAYRIFPPDVIWQVNDNVGHEAVMQMFEKAIVETEGSL